MNTSLCYISLRRHNKAKILQVFGVEVCDGRREARDNGVLLHELFDVEVEAIEKSSFSCALSTSLSQWINY